MPKVTILIVNYNGEGLIGSCLDALERQNYDDFAIVIVDNNSSDGSLNNIEKFLGKSSIASRIKTVPLTKNLGFAGGNDEALKYAEGEYIALINPDAEAGPSWLEQLVVTMDLHPQVGLCASKLVVYGSDVIDSAGDECSTAGVGFKRGEGDPDTEYQELEYVFGACGGAALYRSKMLEEIGFFDEDFFIINEDSDLNFRAQLAGWKCLYVPEAVVHHKVSSIIGKMSEAMVYYSVRNSLYVYVKNMPVKLMIRYSHHKVLQEAGTLLYFMRHGKLRPCLRGYIDFFIKLPGLCEKRKKIKKLRKVTDIYIKKMMTPLLSRKFFKKQINKLLHH